MDKDFIKAKLESAGRTVMMLPPHGTRPRGYTSGWPEILRDFADMIEAPKENTPTKIRATSNQMDELDEVMKWSVLLSKKCIEQNKPHIARTVALASLRRPTSYRPVFKWSQIAKIMHTSPTTIKRWHEEGIDMLFGILAMKNEANRLSKSVIKFRAK